MDETTTDVSVQDTGAQSIPDNQADNTADISQNQAQATQDDTGAAALPDNVDEKLAKFAVSHGLTLDSESAIKAAKIAMDNQSAYQQAQSKASELEKATQVTPTGNLDMDRIARLERELAVNTFKTQNPDYTEVEDVMVQKLQEQVSTPYGVFPRSELVNAGFLSLNDIYTMAKASKPAQANTQEVLQSIVNKQLAGGVPSSATNSAPSAQKDDPIIAAIKKSRENG